MHEIHCLGINFLAQCSESHYAEHFLFNFEAAISSLAIVVAVYTLFLERRFRARIAIKGKKLKHIVGVVLTVLELTFIGAILPYIPGSTLPLVGYPVFWEIIASLLLMYVILLCYFLLRPITSLTKEQILSLAAYAPHSTLKYHGSLDLILREAEFFWKDLLKKSVDNPLLKEVLLNDFSQKDFLRVAAKSPYLLWDTLEFVEKFRFSANIKHAEEFLRDLVLTSLVEKESIIADDLESTYKPLMQEIIRKKKLANVIFDPTELFFLRRNSEATSLRVLKRFIQILNLYLGKTYHHTEKTDTYLGLIDPSVLKVLLEFFQENLHSMSNEVKREFLSELSFWTIDLLRNLSKEKSEVLAEGAYEILEAYSQGRNWSIDSWHERHMCLQFKHKFVDCNEHTKTVFKQRLLEQIVGSEDKNKTTHFVYNLKGFYPMMIPVYFFMYGHDLFTKKVPPEDVEMHMAILKKMKKNLPIIADGRTQEFIDEANMPKDQRGIDVIKKRAEECLRTMFPENVFYDKEANAITYIFRNEEASSTLLLNETIGKGIFIYKEN